MALGAYSDRLDLESGLDTVNANKCYSHLEVKGNEGENERLQILHQVVEDPQPLRICRVSHVHK